MYIFTVVVLTTSTSIYCTAAKEFFYKTLNEGDSFNI
jgi:hypothetical protein